MATGVTTQTGGGINLASPYLRSETSHATYSDGVADIDLAQPLRHKDARLLNDLWATGDAPWNVWEHAVS